MLAKSEDYFCDGEAMREPDSGKSSGNNFIRPQQLSRCGRGNTEIWKPGAGRNLRNCWVIQPQVFKGKHHSIFPEKLVEICILLGTAAQNCEVCGAPWVRVIERGAELYNRGSVRANSGMHEDIVNSRISALGVNTSQYAPDHEWKVYKQNTLGFRPSCACQQNGTGKSIVLDPFMGSGTVARVAESLGRDWIGIDLQPNYAEIVAKRTAVTKGIGILLC